MSLSLDLIFIRKLERAGAKNRAIPCGYLNILGVLVWILLHTLDI